MRLGVQYPIHAGGFAAAYDASSVNDTDWHNLTSDNFYDTRTGDQLPSGLQFAFVEVVSGSTDTKSFLKLRAASSGSDGVANSDGVIPVFATYSVDIQALISGSGVTTVAYKKAAGGDNFVLYVGFNK